MGFHPCCFWYHNSSIFIHTSGWGTSGSELCTFIKWLSQDWNSSLPCSSTNFSSMLFEDKDDNMDCIFSLLTSSANWLCWGLPTYIQRFWCSKCCETPSLMYVAFGGSLEWNEEMDSLGCRSIAFIGITEATSIITERRQGGAYLPRGWFYQDIHGHKRNTLPSAVSPKIPPSSTHVSALLHTLMAVVERERKAFEWGWWKCWDLSELYP